MNLMRPYSRTQDHRGGLDGQLELMAACVGNMGTRIVPYLGLKPDILGCPPTNISTQHVGDPASAALALRPDARVFDHDDHADEIRVGGAVRVSKCSGGGQRSRRRAGSSTVPPNEQPAQSSHLDAHSAKRKTIQGWAVNGVLLHSRSRPNQRARCCSTLQIVDRQFTCLQLGRSPGAKAGVILLSTATAAKLLWPTPCLAASKFP